MHVATTVGPENSTKAVLPFVAAKGAMSRGDTAAIFAMQEATYLGAESHVDLSELKAPGLPPIAAVLEALLENDALDEFVVCEPCARARSIDESDLTSWATFGDSSDFARLAEEHETTVTF